MSDIKIKPSATGSATVTLTAPATGTARTVTLPDGTGSLIADDGSGNIGIGETTPLAKVHIKRGDSGLTSLNAAGDHIFLENTGANGTGITLASGNTANGSIIFGDQDSNYRGVLIYDHSADAMKIVTAGSERMRIDSSGQVGIGTTSPEFPLEIGITSSTSQQVGFEITQATSGNDGRMRFKNSANSTYCRVGMDSSGTFFVEPFNGSAYVKHFNIKNNGNVGINTTAPYGKFEVATQGGSNNYNGNSSIRTGVGWDSEASSHTISYPNFCVGDTASGMLIVHAKADGSGGSAKAGTILLLWTKTHGEGTQVSTLHSHDQKISSFSAGTSGNNIVITTDSDCAITWHSLFAR